jgi:hypothetical protein
MAENKQIFQELSTYVKKEEAAGQSNAYYEDMKYAQKVRKPLTAQIAITNYKNWLNGRKGK